MENTFLDLLDEVTSLEQSLETLTSGTHAVSFGVSTSGEAKPQDLDELSGNVELEQTNEDSLSHHENFATHSGSFGFSTSDEARPQDLDELSRNVGFEHINEDSLSLQENSATYSESFAVSTSAESKPQDVDELSGNVGFEHTNEDSLLPRGNFGDVHQQRASADVHATHASFQPPEEIVFEPTQQSSGPKTSIQSDSASQELVKEAILSQDLKLPNIPCKSDADSARQLLLVQGDSGIEMIHQGNHNQDSEAITSSGQGDLILQPTFITSETEKFSEIIRKQNQEIFRLRVALVQENFLRSQENYSINQSEQAFVTPESASSEIERLQMQLSKERKENEASFVERFSALFPGEQITDEQRALFGNIRSEVTTCLQRNDDVELEKVFKRNMVISKAEKPDSDKSPEALHKDGFEQAWLELGRTADDILWDNIFTVGNESISFEEFKSAIRRRTKLEQFSMSIPTSELVSSCLAAIVLRDNHGGASESNPNSFDHDVHHADPLVKILDISGRDLDLVCMGVAEGCKYALQQRIKILRMAYDKLDEQKKALEEEQKKLEEQMKGKSIVQLKEIADSKFSFCMTGGNVSDFYKGLEARIGHANLNFLRAMKHEHDSDVPFLTPNYNITTCPADEWKIVHEYDPALVKKVEAEYSRHKRKIPDWRRIVADEQRQLEGNAKESALTDVEAIAIILYTGPMYVLYNCVLRQWPKEMYESLKENKYTTTIYCLVSGVTKVSRRTKIPTGLILYRGFGGLKLPEQFYRAADGGYKGYVEWGFMSTTSNKQIAIQYTGIAQGRSYPTLLEIQPAAIDHGADIHKYSQFSAEVEFLWNPCSLIEGQDNESIEVTKDGVVSKICVRMNNNVKTQTVEELRQLKKTLHLDAFKYIKHEISSDLEALIQARYVESRAEADISLDKKSFDSFSASNDKSPIKVLRDTIINNVEERFKKHEDSSAEDFIQDETYRCLVREMMETKPMAISKLRLWLEDSTQSWNTVRGMELRIAHRTLIGFLESELQKAGEETPQAAYELCKMKTLIASSIDEVNELGEPIMIQICAEGTDLQTLQLLVNAGASLNSVDKTGCTALMKAASGGHAETVYALMQIQNMIKKPEAVPNINAKNNEDTTALMLAASKGHDQTINALISLKADINMRDKNRCNALMYASLYGHGSAVDILLKDEAMIADTDIEGSTLIMMAAQGGHTKLVEMFLDKLQTKSEKYKSDKVHINTKNIKGRTALFLAAKGGFTETVKTLLSRNAIIFDQDKRKTTALMLAASNGKLETVELLQQHYLKSLPSSASENECLELIRSVDCHDLSALVHAAENGQTETVLNLIKMKADVTSGLHAVCKLLKDDNDQLIRAIHVLIKYGADINKPDQFGQTPLSLTVNMKAREILQQHEADKWTPLMTAAEQGNIVDSEKHKSTHDIINIDGETALHIAASKGYTDILLCLLSAKSDVNKADKHKRTPLHKAAQNGHAATVKCLITARASVVNVKDKEGRSPLAKCSDASDQCRYILKIMGADGWTPLMLAVEAGERQVQNYLKLREAILCTRMNAAGPSWMQEERSFYSSLCSSSDVWRWKSYDTPDVSRSKVDSNGEVFKTTSKSDYATVLGSKALIEGVHTWELVVEFEYRIWVGVVKNLDEKRGLTEKPDAGRFCDFMLAFDHRGEITSRSSIIEKTISGKFSSGQTIGFELDTSQKTLKFKVDNMLAFVAYDITETGLQPFVCIQKTGNVRLKSRISSVKSTEHVSNSTTNTAGKEESARIKVHEALIPRLLKRLTEENILDLLTNQVYSGKDINLKQENGKNALHIAAAHSVREKRADIVKQLLDSKAEVDGISAGEHSCLHYAASSGDVPTLLHLLRSNANVDSKNHLSQTALHAIAAATENNEPIARYLLMFKANIHAKDSAGRTPLQVCSTQKPATYPRAGEEGLSEVCKLLEQVDQEGLTPLMMATDSQYFDILQKIISEGVDVNVRDKSNQALAAIHLAALKGNIAGIQALLRAKAYIDIEDASKQTPLHKAASAGQLGSLHCLINAGSNIHAVDSESKSVLKIAKDSNCQQSLKKFGADKWTPLSVAAEQGNVERFFLLRDFWICIKNNMPLTPELIKDKEVYFDLAFKKSNWSWQSAKRGEFSLSEDKKVITMENTGQVWYAVGDCAFQDGVHTWEIQLQSVHNIMVGIARDIDEKMLSGQSSSSGQGCILAFCGGQAPVIIGNESVQVVRKIDNFQFNERDLIRIDLDMRKHALSLRVNGILAWVASNVDVSSVRPYISMNRGTAILISQGEFSSFLESTVLDTCREDQLKKISNSMWAPLSSEAFVSISGRLNSAAKLSPSKLVREFEDILDPEYTACASKSVEKWEAVSDLEDTAIMLAAGSRLWGLSFFNYLIMRLADEYCCGAVSRLIENFEDINLTTKADNRTALHIAAEKGHADTVRNLLLHGTDFKIKDSDGKTAMDLATVDCRRILASILPSISNNQCGEEQSVAEFHEPLSEQSVGWTLTMLAAETGSADWIRHSLRQFQENINAKNSLQETALHIAAKNNNLEAVAALIEAAADVGAENSRQQTALHIAASNGSSDIVRIILAHCSDKLSLMENRDSDGYTVMHRAASCNPEVSKTAELVRVLVENKASVNVPDTVYSPLHQAASINNCGMVLGLLRAKANICALDDSARTPIEVSTMEQCKYILKVFGAGNWTPLMVCTELGDSELRAYIDQYRLLCELFSSCHNKTSFPKWFQDETVSSHALSLSIVMKAEDWVWGTSEKRLIRSQNGLTITKQFPSSPDYSCALGSEVFGIGIHVWELTVSSVDAMWVGIARGVEESKQLETCPSRPGNDGFLLAFSNNGYIEVQGENKISFRSSSYKRYRSGDKLRFKLDTCRHILKFYVNELLAVIAVDVDDVRVRPYLCLDYEESVLLGERQSRTVQNIATFEEANSGLQNSDWTDAQDSALRQILHEGFLGSDDDSTVLKAIKSRFGSVMNGKSPASLISRLNVIANLDDRLEELVLCGSQDCFIASEISEQIQLCNCDGRSALHIATLQRDEAAIQTLIAYQAEINAPDKNGETPLQIALKNHDACFRLISRMIPTVDLGQAEDRNHRIGDQPDENSADVQTEFGWTPLMVATEIGDVKQMQALLRNQNFVNRRNSRQEASLHIAARIGKVDVIKLLMDSSAEIEALDSSGFTPLCTAAKYGKFKAVQTIAEKANLAIKVQTGDSLLKSILDLTADTECARFLKGLGVDGWTPLMTAVEKGCYSVIKYLRSRECVLCIRDSEIFPSWFHKEFEHYFNIESEPEKSHLKWGEHEQQNLIVDEQRRTVSKERDRPDYSSVLADVTFGSGVHRWKVKVNNVQSMWIGVARGVHGQEQLSMHPRSSTYSGNQEEERLILAFGPRYSETIFVGNKKPNFTFFRTESYQSGSTIEFELDSFDLSLKCWVDDELMVIASNLECKELSPYACMDYNESIELLSSSSFALPKRTSSLNEPLKDTMICLHNANWSAGLDNELWMLATEKARVLKLEDSDYTYGGPYIKSDGSDPDLLRSLESLVTIQDRPQNLAVVKMRFNVLSFLRNFLCISGLEGSIQDVTLHLSQHGIDSQNSKKQTALHIAVTKSNLEAVKALLRFKASTEVRDELEQTPLHCASLNGDEDIVKELLHAKANVQSLTKTGKSCLDCALDSKSLRCIAILKMVGTDEWTPLMVAAENGLYLLKEYLEVRENCLALRDRSKFRDSFQQEVHFFSNLTNCNSEKQSLTWDSSTMDRTNENTMARSHKDSNFSYALGTLLGEGVHIWQLGIGEFSDRIWVGVAKNLDTEGVNPFKSSPKSYVVCFGSDGVYGVGGACPKGRTVSFDALFANESERSYRPGQVVEFCLDTFKASLKISINGILAVIAYNMDTQDIRPYVCSSAELRSVTITTLKSEVLSEATILIAPDEQSAGLDNSIWSIELDAALKHIFQEDFRVYSDFELQQIEDLPQLFGKRFIVGVQTRNEKLMCNDHAWLSALSGLNTLLHRIVQATGSISDDVGFLLTMLSSENDDSNNDLINRRNLLLRSVGGAVVVRMRALCYVDKCLNKITELHCAETKMKRMICDGTDINAKNKNNRSVVSLAAGRGLLDSVRTLIDNGADIEVKDESAETVLHSAAKAGNAALIKALVSVKADVDSKNCNNKTPLDVAVNDECRHVLRVLGANGWTALMVAAERGEDQFQKYFYLRNCIMCMDPTWTWMSHSEGVEVEKSEILFKKPGCVLGNDKFEKRSDVIGENIYRWELKMSANTEGKFWAGIVGGMNKLNLWALSPVEIKEQSVNLEEKSHETSDLLLTYCSDGQLHIVGRGYKLVSSRVRIYEPEQRLIFVLDMDNGHLELSIKDGKGLDERVMEVSELNTSALQPYIFLDSRGSADLKCFDLPSFKFPSDFQSDVRFYSSLSTKEIDWGWGVYDHEGMVLNNLEIRRGLSMNSYYSLALGSDKLTDGVHSWSLTVDRSDIMWAGVIRGADTSPLNLIVPPCNLPCQMAASFCSDGRFEHFGSAPDPKVRYISGTEDMPHEWRLQEKVEFHLDTHKRTLELFVNEQRAIVVSEFKCSNVLPFVCLASSGSVTLSKPNSKVINVSSSIISFKDRAAGLDNSKWKNMNLNSPLFELPMAAEIKNYTNQDIHQLNECIEQLTKTQDLHQSNNDAPSIDSIRSQIKGKALGAVATRLNVRATIKMLVDQVSEDSYAQKLESLIQSRADINKVNADGYNALYIATEKGQIHAVRVLLQHRADVRATGKDTKLSCLHAAAASGGNTEIIRCLIATGADIDALDSSNRSLLHLAAKKGNKNIIDIPELSSMKMLEAADINGRTPLHISVDAGNYDFAQALIEVGVDVSAKDKNEDTALSLTKSPKLKMLLKEVCADGWTPIMVAAGQRASRFEKLLEALKCIESMQAKVDFPTWFQNAVRFRYSLGDEFIWSLRSTETNLITKTSSDPDCLCVLGDHILEHGIHRWTVTLDSVEGMWMGIARGVEEVQALDCNPLTAQERAKEFMNDFKCNDFVMIAFHSGGGDPHDEESESFCSNRNVQFEILADLSFKSGQTVEFQLDTFMKTLKLKVDGILVVIASDMCNCDGVQPYFCLGCKESITLVSTSSRAVPQESCEDWGWVTPPEGPLSLGPERTIQNKGSGCGFALGSKPLENGIHKWFLDVMGDQDSLWIGVAVATEGAFPSDLFPFQCKDGELLCVLSYDGTIFNNFGGDVTAHVGRSLDPAAHMNAASAFRIETELDMFEGSLKLRAHNVLALFVTGLRGKTLRPYIASTSGSVKLSQVYSHLLAPASWVWGAFDENSVKIDCENKDPNDEDSAKMIGQENMLVASKHSNRPDFSAVLGNENIDEGIHRWQLQVDNVDNIVIGIARNIGKNKLLGHPFYRLEGDDTYMVGFHNSGNTVEYNGTQGSHVPFTTVLQSGEFHSGDAIEVEMNNIHNNLKLFVKGTLTTIIWDVIGTGALPYVCMDEKEAVVLRQRHSVTKQWMPFYSRDAWQAALNNKIWSQEINDIMLTNPLTDTANKFTAKDLEWMSIVYKESDIIERHIQDEAADGLSPNVKDRNMKANFKSICKAYPYVEGCLIDQQPSALALRINVVALAKHLLGLPSARRLKATKTRMLDSILDIKSENFQGFAALDIAAFSGQLKNCEKLLDILKKSAEEELNSCLNSEAAEASASRSESDSSTRSAVELQLLNALKCAAWGGNSRVIRLLLGMTKDLHMRLAGVGLEMIGGELPEVVYSPEDDSLDGKLFPLKVKFKNPSAVRSTFFCPAKGNSWFEVEFVSVGDEPCVGITTKLWSGTILGGSDVHSLGFQGRSWKDGDIVRLVTNLEDRKVKAILNGDWNSAQEIPIVIDFQGQQVFPAFSGRSATARFRFSNLMPATQGMLVENFSFPADRVIALPCCRNDHKLVLTRRDNGWYCDARKEGGCKRGQLSTRGIPRYRCNACDYDLCEPCYKDRRDTEQVFRWPPT